MGYSTEERVELVMIYARADNGLQQTSMIFHERHPNRPRPSIHCISDLIRKFRTTGSVLDAKRSGRPKTATGEAGQTAILAQASMQPQQSTREMSRAVGISESSVRRILKLHKFHPYKLHIVQELSDDDFDRRVEFCETFAQKIAGDPNLPLRICFSDEATFFLNGNVNKHNCRYWSQENPHEFREAHTQKPQKVNVWAGILANKIVGPFFIEGNFTGEKYLDLLRRSIKPAIAQIIETEVDDHGEPLLTEDNVMYQQDGAPPHYAREVRQYLDETFANKWIGRRGAYEWPPRSPDLTPMDFFLWGHIKTILYRTPPQSLEDLKVRIQAACKEISAKTLERVRADFEHRLYYCLQEGGAQFEQFL